MLYSKITELFVASLMFYWDLKLYERKIIDQSLGVLRDPNNGEHERNVAISMIEDLIRSKGG